MTDTPIRTVRVPNEIWLPAHEVAEANGETLSVVIRRALVKYVKENAS